MPTCTPGSEPSEEASLGAGIVRESNGGYIPCPRRPGRSRDRQTVAEAEEQARTQLIASLDQVRLAVLERAAEISYIPTER